jgi:hypothetical protein
MIVCENRALFECIRDRCKRTGTDTVVRIAKQTPFLDNLLLSCALLFFWYEPLCTSLRGFRRRLFMERLNLKNSATPHIFIYGFLIKCERD